VLADGFRVERIHVRRLWKDLHADKLNSEHERIRDDYARQDSAQGAHACSDEGGNRIMRGVSSGRECEVRDAQHCGM
jgi:hypothetical protein